MVVENQQSCRSRNPPPCKFPGNSFIYINYLSFFVITAHVMKYNHLFCRLPAVLPYRVSLEGAVWIPNAIATTPVYILLPVLYGLISYINCYHMSHYLFGQEDGKSASAGGRTIGNVTVIHCLLDLCFWTSVSGPLFLERLFLDFFFRTSFS